MGGQVPHDRAWQLEGQRFHFTTLKRLLERAEEGGMTNDLQQPPSSQLSPQKFLRRFVQAQDPVVLTQDEQRVRQVRKDGVRGCHRIFDPLTLALQFARRLPQGLCKSWCQEGRARLPMLL